MCRPERVEAAVGEGAAPAGVLGGPHGAVYGGGAGADRGHAPCGTCTHVHRVTETLGALTVTWDPACSCGCIASGVHYDRGISDTGDLTDLLASIARHPSSAVGGPSDAGPTLGVVEGQRVRGARQLARPWVDVFRGIGLEQRELASLWRTAIRILRGRCESR